MAKSKESESERNAELDISKVNANFKKKKNKAKELIKDPVKTRKTIEEAIIKAEKVKGPLEKVWSHLQLMFSLVRDYFKGNYKTVPTGSLIAIIAGILYFLSPVDVIPDLIPIVGYIDDVFVLGVVFAQVQSDLDKYKLWKDNIA